MKNNFYSWIRLCLLACFLVGLAINLKAQSSFSGDTWQSVKQKGSGTLSVVYYEGTGMVHKGSNGQMSGLCVDILDDFKDFVKSKYGKTLRIKYVHQEKDWMKFLNTISASKGGVVALSNITITMDRKKKMGFTPPFITNPMIMLTGKDAPKISNVSELKTTYKDYSVIVVEGTTHVNYAKAMKKIHNPDLNIIYAKTPAETMDRAAREKNLFAIIDMTEYYYAVHKKLPLKRQPVTVSNNREKLGFALPKGSDWEALWAEFLTPEYKKSDAYKEIISKNLGAQFTALIL
ncbi:MAG: transporter substrate-binding domain-containing protein [Bacteroidota bacterium]